MAKLQHSERVASDHKGNRNELRVDEGTPVSGGKEKELEVAQGESQSLPVEPITSEGPSVEDIEDCLDIQSGLRTAELYRRSGRSAFVSIQAFRKRSGKA